MQTIAATQTQLVMVERLFDAKLRVVFADAAGCFTRTFCENAGSAPQSEGSRIEAQSLFERRDLASLGSLYCGPNRRVVEGL